MACPYREYRRESETHTFDHARPFCAAASTFVQPMRADICAERFGLSPADHCEIYREHDGDNE